MRYVPDNIVKPDYFHTGIPGVELQDKHDRQIYVNSKEDIKIMKEACILGKFPYNKILSIKKDEKQLI